MPISLNSFISPSVFNTETASTPLYAGLLAGGTYKAPVFDGKSGSSSIDPGGLFGWLIYSRSQLASPVRGFTYDKYIQYNSYNSLLNDLNLLAGKTALMVNKNTGATYTLFSYDPSIQSPTPNVTPSTIGYDFLYALNYLSYGGVLVIAGTCGGFTDYQTKTSKSLDILIGQTANASTAQFLEKNDYIFGVFPAIDDGNGLGAGYTAPNFDQYFSAANDVQFISGATVADRIFNISGISTKTLNTDTLQPGTNLQYFISCVSDIAGAFNRSKNKQDLPYTVAGINYSIPLNNTINNVVTWTDDTTKNIYKKNRVNFYSQIQNNNNTKTFFLASDLVGATASSGITYSSIERIGPSYLANLIEKNVKSILLKYLYSVNNASTRASVTTETSLYIQSLNEYLDSTYTSVICSSANNTDNSTVLTVDITVKPIVTAESYTFSLTVPTS